MADQNVMPLPPREKQPPVPDAALETHMAILGKVGSGKTFTAKGLVERLLHARRHVVVIDPTGAWWGLRTGFDIPIFGGRKGDVEIGDKAGPAVARVIVEQRTSAIIDLSLMSGGAQRRFMAGFAHELRRLKIEREPAPLYLAIDEADEFLPQVLQPDMTQLFGDLKWMVRRGRLNGFRVAMITQRPAEIAKAVLTQIETLIAHRLTAPQDRKAIEEWVKGHHEPSEAHTVLTSLASLDKGEAWVWAPDLGILSRSRMPMIETFDSSRTPEPGEAASEPPALSDLDLSAIREALATEPEPKKRSGTAAPAYPDLRERVAELEAQLAGQIARADEAERRIALAAKALGSGNAPIPADVVAPVPAPVLRVPMPSKNDGSGNPTALAILALLDRINPARVSWTQAAAMVGRKPSGGNFNAARKWLRDSGRIVEDGEIIQSAADAPEGMTRSEALDLWRSVLSNPAPRMIDALLAGPLDKERIGAALGAKPTGGNFNSGLAQLRRNGVVTESGGLFRLADPLPGQAA